MILELSTRLFLGKILRIKRLKTIKKKNVYALNTDMSEGFGFRRKNIFTSFARV